MDRPGGTGHTRRLAAPLKPGGRRPGAAMDTRHDGDHETRSDTLPLGVAAVTLIAMVFYLTVVSHRALVWPFPNHTDEVQHLSFIHHLH